MIIKKGGLIIILLFSYFLSWAQSSKIPENGKPTYEETIEFLKLHFAHPDRTKSLSGSYTEYDLYFHIDFKVLDVTFSDCILNVKYEKSTQVLDKTARYKKINEKIESFSSRIDLSKVEKIVFWRFGEKTWWTYGFSFNIKGEVSKTRMELPYKYNYGDPSPYEMKDDQVYKAFNHLRKLCGAPEPIKF
jgi:hypothetical protein